MKEKTLKVVAIIAVRLKSSRLHHKALADIAGLPMFVHTCKRTALAKTIDRVYLATDSYEIKDIAEKHNIEVIMTASSHTNSSERIAEACQSVDADIVVNVQGDEPLVYPDHIDKVVSLLLSDDTVQVGIGITKFNKRNSPGDIKAVVGTANKLLYASRNDIPCFYMKQEQPLLKLCFIVPFRKSVLLQYLKWKPTELEIIEDNHFLRIIENNIPIHTVEIDQAKISVDTEADLIEVRQLIKHDPLVDTYKTTEEV